jgi:DNA-binding transcriptional ArsR family regulator
MARNRALKTLPRSATVFAALGDETRLRVVTRLGKEGPLSLARLTEGEEVTRQAVSKHLQVLALAGLIEGKREGREQIWRLSAAGLSEARGLLDQISGQWDDTLLRLKSFVER